MYKDMCLANETAVKILFAKKNDPLYIKTSIWFAIIKIFYQTQNVFKNA